MSDVVKLRDVSDSSPKEEVVALLRSTLEKAERGDVLSIAIAYCCRNGNTNTAYANSSNKTGLRDLVAAAQLLLFRITDDWFRG